MDVRPVGGECFKSLGASGSDGVREGESEGWEEDEERMSD